MAGAGDAMLSFASVRNWTWSEPLRCGVCVWLHILRTRPGFSDAICPMVLVLHLVWLRQWLRPDGCACTGCWYIVSTVSTVSIVSILNCSVVRPYVAI